MQCLTVTGLACCTLSKSRATVRRSTPSLRAASFTIEAVIGPRAVTLAAATDDPSEMSARGWPDMW